MKFLEHMIEKIIYSGRWLLAPIFLILNFVIILIMIKFTQITITLFGNIMTIPTSDFILQVLTLIDLILLATLVVMVMFSGYENFVSALDRINREQHLTWLSRLDASTLKKKVVTSIIAISAIHLLKIFMSIQSIPNEEVITYGVIHLIFILSGIGISYAEELIKKNKKKPD